MIPVLRSLRSAAFALFALLAIFAPSTAAATEDPLPNFIVVFTDNLGYGDIEPFGSTLHRTPNLNRMAAEGRKFTHFCVTAGVCTPSRASLMTGCYSQRVGMHHNPRDNHVIRPVSPYGLHPDELTVAEALKPLGYATSMIGKWHLGDQDPFLPTRRGFDEYWGIPYSDDMTERLWEQDGSRWPPLPLMENETVIEAPVDRDYLTLRETQRALDWIERKKDEPFFLYLPQAMPGSTAEPFSSPAFRGRSANGPWGDSVEELDWSIGQILDKLVELGIDERTLVLWTSDNGAPIRPDREDLSRGSNRPLHGTGYTTAEGAFRVPTIAWWPGTIPAGTVCEELATTMDVLPTLVSLAGGSLPDDGRIRDGHDITPLLKGVEGAATPYERFAYYYLDQLQAVRSGPWKLFVPLEDFIRHPHYQGGGRGKGGVGGKARPRGVQGPLLFHLYDDFACERDVSAEHPEVVAELLAHAEAFRADLGDAGAPGPGMRERGQVENPVPRTIEPLALWPDGAPRESGLELPAETSEDRDGDGIVRVSNVSDPALTFYSAGPPGIGKASGATVLVCPGGGYNILAIDHEGEQVCRWLNGLGIHAALLKYRVPRREGRAPHKAPLEDARRALEIIRERADEWKVDPERVGILGFSAGGHLAAMALLKAGNEGPRPDFGLLIYPAYLQDEENPEQLSPALEVGPGAPPVFLAVSHDDRRFVEGSAMLYLALRRAEATAALHIFPDGGHGFGMKETGKTSKRWPELAAEWLATVGIHAAAD